MDILPLLRFLSLLCYMFICRVGASAACLAATSFDSHSHSIQFSSAMSQENWKGALDPDKAEELDTLIQAGDWEGKSMGDCT